MLKTVYPTKTTFCGGEGGGYNKRQILLSTSITDDTSLKKNIRKIAQKYHQGHEVLNMSEEMYNVNCHTDNSEIVLIRRKPVYAIVLIRRKPVYAIVLIRRKPVYAIVLIRRKPVYAIVLIRRKPVYAICEQQRRRSACASSQSNQRLCCSLPR